MPARRAATHPCPHSPWVGRANTLHGIQQNTPEWHTVNFLITNNCYGYNNRASIHRILGHLNTLNCQLSREAFQQGALGNLKRNGIIVTLIYPGRQGGVFIPCDAREVESAAKQLLDRVISELANFQGSATGMPLQNHLQPIIQAAQNVRNQIP